MTVGGTAADTATVTGYNPTGTVNFTLYDSCGGTIVFTSNNVPLLSGEATSASWTSDAAGDYFWVAEYSGDTNNAPFTTTCGDANETLTVTAETSSVTTQADPVTVTVGGTAADTATVTGYNPTGTVNFTLYDSCGGTIVFTSNNVPLLSGEATSASWTSDAAGDYFWVAEYSGDTNNAPFTTTCGDANETLTVTAETSSVTTQADPVTVTVGGTAADTATVTGYNPTGTVNFTLYDSCGGTIVFTSNNVPLLSGEATSASWTSDAAGDYFWVAEYSGDTNNAPFTTTCGDANETLTVTAETSSVTTQADPVTVTVGGTAADTATVTGYNPTGTVNFTLYDSCGGTIVFTSNNVPLLSGEATSASWTSDAAGDYFWVAEYSGDTNNAPFTTTCGDTNETLTVTKATSTITTNATPSSVVVGGTATDTATVTGHGTPTGNVTFWLYNNDQCSGDPVFTSANITLTGGSATSGSYTTTAPGTYYWKVGYWGDVTNEPTMTGCGDTNETLTVIEFGTICGYKFIQDCTEEGCGLSGWTITLYYASNGTVYASTITGVGGKYQFDHVPYGTYWVNETLIAGWKQITPNTLVTLNDANPVTVYNFINAKDETCCICPPTAYFTYMEIESQTVHFTDASTGPEAVHWIWLFGDGTMSTLQNPEHFFSKPGVYTVQLYITWADCDGITYDWESSSRTIKVS